MRNMKDVKFMVTKRDGTVTVVGLPLTVALHLRRKIETEFDAQANLKVIEADDCVLYVRGANGEPLGEDETAERYEWWIQGWCVGYDDPELVEVGV